MSESKPIDASRALALGRSLHLGVIGLGQCGGNIAQAFAAREYPVLAINTSKADLRSLSGIADSHKLAIGDDGRYGSGGSLSTGGEALRGAQAKIEELALNHFDDVEMVLVVGGLGGGTGGNLAELASMLAAQEFPVVAVGAIPASAEGHRAKTNALWALNELVDSEAEAIMLIDNDKLFEAHSGTNVARFMSACNEAFVDGLDSLNRLAGDDKLRSIRTFDPNDLRQVLRFGGVTVFGCRKIEGGLNRDTLLAGFMEVLNQNALLAGSFECEDAVMIGSVISANESTLAATAASAFEDYLREVKQLTHGAAHRTGLYASDGPAMLHLVVAGLPLPSRARDLLGETTEESKAFGEKKLSARSKLKKLDLSGLGIGAEPAAGNNKGQASEHVDVREDGEVEGVVTLDGIAG
jgi:cell division GTPase FtsZ